MNVCLTDIPGDWSQALTNSAVVVPSSLFSPEVINPTDNIAFGYFNSASQQGVAQLDLNSGTMRVLSVMPPQASGVLSMSYADPWLVWAQGESQTNGGAWTLKAMNTRTGQQLPLPLQTAAGTGPSQLSFPVVAPQFLAWSQRVSTTSAELRALRFDAKDPVTIDSGGLSSPVVAGNKLVWTKSDGSGTEASIRMADVASLQPIQVPPALAKSRKIQNLAGSLDYLVWTEGRGSLFAYQFRPGRTSSYSFTSDALNHPFQFLQVAGHYLVWFTGSVNTVLDLETGNGFDVDLPSSIAGSDQEIVIAKIQGTKTGPKSTTVSTIGLDRVSTLRTCKR
jgi:hypothetical protein